MKTIQWTVMLIFCCLCAPSAIGQDIATTSYRLKWYTGCNVPLDENTVRAAAIVSDELEANVRSISALIQVIKITPAEGQALGRRYMLNWFLSLGFNLPEASWMKPMETQCWAAYDRDKPVLAALQMRISQFTARQESDREKQRLIEEYNERSRKFFSNMEQQRALDRIANALENR